MIKISKIFGDFVSLCQGLLQRSRHFENRRGEGPGDEVGHDRVYGGRLGGPLGRWSSAMNNPKVTIYFAFFFDRHTQP